MPLDNSQSPQIEGCKRQETLSSHSPEEDDEEEEDVDFNPFMKETSSPEASSSLSSDNEGLGADAVYSWGSPSARKKTSLALDSVARIQECTIHNEEEVLMPKADSLEEERRKLSKSDVTRRPKRRKLVSNSEDWYSSKEIVATEMNTASSGNDVVEDTRGGVSTNAIHSTDDLMEVDDEDAICKRTRARYSLANFSLDELETFLQETDDDEDLHNVDDEQEYRKFLTAVLQGGENEDQSIQEDENVYDEDEDEDSDVDFEIELEEALDSDHDESIRGKKNGGRGVGCRPKTRQNNHNEKKFLVQADRPLRPLVPRVANTQVQPFSSILHFPPSSQAGLPVGFTPHQIGQLHCLIHEHTQLLVQVFSLSVLDPSRQQIASETRQLISELVSKCEKVLSWRKVPYPDYCFRPPCIHSSVSDGPPKIYPSLLSVDASSSGHKEALGMIPNSHSSFPFRTRVNNGGHDDSLQTTKDSLWLPRVSGPILSILDVAPLRIVGSYMDEVSRATQECKRRHVEGTYDTRIERIPLFPANISLTPEANEKASKVATSQGPTTVSSPSKVHQSPKKTLAATLVESTKKQSIAFAPKEIVTLAQRFYPLFNAELYPHKPPPVTVANRVLFTDREDELLAMGLMEYNTDWKAIQQRFLPCKSKHQIFVRQKNRCSSKAPENPIKAVRRMKTSPLTAEEKVHIHKGLKAFKHDWMSVWKFIVPYRDPSLLPRQWRVALGTQKSYKTDTAKKEKRRLYLAQKKLGKTAPLVNLPTASEKEDVMDMNNSTAEGNKSEDDNMEDEDEAYVHEAFLADWRPRNSRPVSFELAHARLDGKNMRPGNTLPQEHFCASGIPTGDWNGRYQPEHIYTRDFFHSNSPHDLHNVSHFTHVKYSASYTVASNHFSPDYLSKPSKSQVVLRPRRVRKKKDAQSVKLAPGLPPVNLPPSVRVVSQSAFKSYHCVTSHSTKISTSGVETENLLPSSAHVVKSGMAPSMNAGNRGSTQSSHHMAINCSQEPRIDSDDNSADTGLQLHPLLLQSPEDGQLSHRPVNTSTCMSNTLNFMERNHRQANFSHICKPTHAGSTVDGFYTTLSSMDSSKSCGIDFHPLLQRRDVSFTQLLNSSDPVMSEPPPLTNVPQATAPIPASPSEDAEELDLEIHLSSTSRKKKVSTERKVIEQCYNGSRGLLNFGILKETDKSNNSSERVESFPVASLAGSSSNDNALLLSNNSSFTENCVGDQSHPEIVMEQEELSDSEEENGEDVEFECEEMDDSEREESDCG